jgi:hypothetical protein
VHLAADVVIGRYELELAAEGARRELRAAQVVANVNGK